MREDQLPEGDKIIYLSVGVRVDELQSGLLDFDHLIPYLKSAYDTVVTEMDRGINLKKNYRTHKLTGDAPESSDEEKRRILWCKIDQKIGELIDSVYLYVEKKREEDGLPPLNKFTDEMNQETNKIMENVIEEIVSEVERLRKEQKND